MSSWETIPFLAIGLAVVASVAFAVAAVVFGLQCVAASTVLTLVLVPCLYTLLEDGWQMVGRVWSAGARGA